MSAMIVGLTGGIATGKSTIARTLEKLGAYIIDADKVSREVTDGASQGIVKLFGNAVMNADGSINRATLAGIVFADKMKLRELEGILHPLITKEITKRIFEYNKNHMEENYINKASVIVIDAPLLIEAGLHSICDEVWLTYLQRGEQLRRLIARNNLTTEEANARINAQSSFEHLAGYADIIIPTTRGIEKTEEIVGKQWARITRR